MAETETHHDEILTLGSEYALFVDVPKRLPNTFKAITMDLSRLDDLPAPEFVFDIGANVGAWTRMAAQHWPKAWFYMIEANPGCKTALADTEDIMHPRANSSICLLGDSHRQQVPFYSAGASATGDSIYREHLTGIYENCEIKHMPMYTIDMLFDGLQVDLIKIDTQGSVLDILRGGTEVVSTVPVVILEVSVTPYNEDAPLKQDVMDYMESIGFTEARVLAETHTGVCNQQDIAFIRDGHFPTTPASIDQR